jgi:hypothetical protein
MRDKLKWLAAAIAFAAVLLLSMTVLIGPDEPLPIPSPKVKQHLPNVLAQSSGVETIVAPIQPEKSTRRTELPLPWESGAAIKAPEPASSLFEAAADNEPEWLSLEDTVYSAIEISPPEGLAVLAPLLDHSSARVRAEAADAIILLNLPAASKILRAAASKATSPQERLRLEQAAAYNDLPTADPERDAKSMRQRGNSAEPDLLREEIIRRAVDGNQAN